MWIVTKKVSAEIVGFNLSDNQELWVTRADKKGLKIAKGKEAINLYLELCDMVTKTEPTISEGKEGWMKNIE